MSSDGTRIGSLKQVVELRARIAELEAELAAERAWRGSSAPEDIARRFHDAYEHFAPQFGYATRPESRKEWDELPQNLRDLMIAVVRNVLIEWPAAERKRRGADETDAARYRWLREWRARWEIRYWNGIYWNQLITDELGAAIDAAIAAERGGK